jgi:O-antigen ligase
VGFGAYSALVSVLQFTGPARLVWPRYIVDSPTWPERAVGVFNQPVINGLTLVVGFLAALLLAVEGGYRKPVRVLALAVAAACVLGLYLTRTRVAWLAFVGVLLIGAVAGGRQRRYFVATLTAMTLGAVVMWGQLRSTDRQAGGLGSPTEVEDRLNGIATSLWAAQERPLTGWGIGRFESVNTFHHLQWSTEVPWKRGYGLASHFDVMGILVELGVIGVALWLAVLALIVAALVRAVRSLPPAGVADRPFALMALMAFVAWILTGLTVELRFFDYPNIVAMLVAGAAVGRARRTRDRPSSPTAGSARSSLRTVAA